MSKKENPNAVYLGRAIACTRIEQGFRRKDLVEAAGISYPYLAELENGNKWPSLPMLQRIAEGLGVGSLYLLSRAKCIGEDYPLPSSMDEDSWELALQTTDARRGANRNTEAGK